MRADISTVYTALNIRIDFSALKMEATFLRTVGSQALYWPYGLELSSLKLYSHQLMHFLIIPCISLLSYIKIT